MVLECKGICYRIGKDRNPLFVEKRRYNYSIESECKICDIGIKKTTFRDLELKIGCESNPNTRYYNIKGKLTQTVTIVPSIIRISQEVICPCCHAEAKGKKLSQVKEYFKVVNGNKENPVYIKTNPLENKEKSYKEGGGGTRSGHRRLTSDLILDLKDFLRCLDTADYEYKLEILKDYDTTALGISNSSSWTRLDNFRQNLEKLKDDKQRQRYIRKFLKLLDEFARKNKLELGGLTQEEQKIESKKRLYEGIRRDAEAEARGDKIEYVPVVDIITDDKEDETKTNNVNGH